MNRKTFKDNTGGEWEPEVNVVTIGRVRAMLDINLLELVVPESDLGQRLTDPCLLVNVIYLLCKDQADKGEISDEEFGRLMTPPPDDPDFSCIEDAAQLMIEGVINFSPRGIRPAHRKVLEAARTFQKKQAEKINTLVESQGFEKMLNEEIDKQLVAHENAQTEPTGDAGNSPESSESSREDTPSQP